MVLSKDAKQWLGVVWVLNKQARISKGLAWFGAWCGCQANKLSKQARLWCLMLCGCYMQANAWCLV